MSGIRISGGKFKGRVIPFNNRAFGNADVTTGKVKEALFSLIDDLGGIGGSVFCDLFAGSGQIAFEALSRGAARVICCDADRNRFKFIEKFADSIGAADSMMMMNMPARDALRLAAKRGVKPDFIFLDPPYDKSKVGGGIYQELLGEIDKRGLADEGTVVAIQHFAKNELPQTHLSFCKIKSKSYGSSALTFYRADGKGT